MAYNPLLQGLTFSQQAAQQYQQTQNQAQGMNLGQLAAQAHNQFGNAYNTYAQLGQQAQMVAQQSAYNISRDQWIDQRYMIDGTYMTLQEFIDIIWPEDCADKTFFLLKHTKETK
jgi:hypothetical protein